MAKTEKAKTDKQSDAKAAKAPKAEKAPKVERAPKVAPPEVVEEVGGVQLEPYQVLVRPLVTEKGVAHSEKLNEYAFEIHTMADKATVKNAIEELYKVRVAKVRTQTRVGKLRRFKARAGVTKAWKKALVTLHPEDRINFF